MTEYSEYSVRHWDENCGYECLLLTESLDDAIEQAHKFLRKDDQLNCFKIDLEPDGKNVWYVIRGQEKTIGPMSAGPANHPYVKNKIEDRAMKKLIENIKQRDTIIEALKNAPNSRIVSGIGGQGQIWYKPNRYSNIIITYHPRKNKTYFHNDILMHECFGDYMGFLRYDSKKPINNHIIISSDNKISFGEYEIMIEINDKGLLELTAWSANDGFENAIISACEQS